MTTESRKKIHIPDIPSNPLHIPTREEFHREYAGKITNADFNTSHPSRYRFSNFMAAYRFNCRARDAALTQTAPAE